MKRKLISYDAFANIKNNSLSSAEAELLETEDVLAKALELDNLSLVCYGPEHVLFEDENGAYVQATYTINDKYVDFDNIEQLILDESSELDHAKDLLRKMVEAIVEDRKVDADGFFQEYIDQNFFSRSIEEGFKIKATASTGTGRRSPFRGKRRPGGRTAALKAARTRKLHARSISPSMKKQVDRQRALAARKLGGKDIRTGKGKRAIRTYIRFVSPSKAMKKMKEWTNLSENVLNFIDYQEFGPVLNETSAQYDEKGNVVSLRVPTLKTRNEAKILTLNYKTLNTDLKILRSSAKTICENAEFCKAVANLKRQNALSDMVKTQEAVEDIVSQFPGVLYLTQIELAKIIAEALESVNATNYDDEMCDFMSEAILRTAHETYTDRVEKVNQLSGNKIDKSFEDAYEAFKVVANEFYAQLDEHAANDMQVFVDLYEAVREVFNIAVEYKDAELKSECAIHLNELAAIIEQSVAPSLEVALEAAEWLNDIVETNLEGGEWDVSNNVHITTNGDHPITSKHAAKGYAPSSDFSGDWGDELPVSDGKSYKSGEADKMKNNSWGNIGGKDTYPDLSNPYLPQSGTFKIHGEKAVEDDDGLATWGGKDTWPSLENPYNPKAETPYTYKMNGGKEKDLIVDK